MLQNHKLALYRARPEVLLLQLIPPASILPRFLHAGDHEDLRTPMLEVNVVYVIPVPAVLLEFWRRMMAFARQEEGLVKLHTATIVAAEWEASSYA